jgi:hypothetical protein
VKSVKSLKIYYLINSDICDVEGCDITVSRVNAHAGSVA